jgi:outer membrane protein, adhesin transport system
VVYSIRRALLGSVLLVAFAAHAQHLPKPLVDATQAALLSNPEVQASWKAFRSTQFAQDVARAGLRPQVDASASAGRQRLTDPATPTTSFSTGGVGLTLNQVLFDGGAVRSDILRADAIRLKSYYDLLETTEVVALDAFQAYANLVRQQELVRLATENYVEHKQMADLLQERFQAAVGRGVDFQQAAGRLALAESTLVEETMALQRVGSVYQRVVGTMPPKTLPAWPEGAALAQLPSVVQEVLAKGYKTSPLLLAAAANVKASQEALDGASSAYLPTVEARANVNRDRNVRAVLGTHDNWTAELGVRQNLYRGGADQSRESRARALALQAEAQMESTCREVRETLVLRHKDIGRLARDLLLQDERLMSVEKSRVAFRQQFDIGQRTLLDLLDTQNEYFETSRVFTNVRFDELIAQARATAAMGQLVALLTRDSQEWPGAKELDLAPMQLDPAVQCAQWQDVVRMASLDEIKAGLDIPTRPKLVVSEASYVALIPNDDGQVGQVTVSGVRGSQQIARAEDCAAVSGSQPPKPCEPGLLEADFKDARAARPALPEEITLLFRFGTTRLTPEGEEAWVRVVDRIKQRQSVDVTVAGHTDSVSSERFNDALSLKRARYIEARLRQLNLELVAIEVVGYGERLLAVQTPDNTQEPRNRRAVVTIR